MADRRFPVEIAGQGFLVDRSNGKYGRQSIPLQKAQQDTSDLPGEQSLNPDDLWRRSFESWHLGAGQGSFDRSGSDPSRFRSSLGVDPWEKWEMSLLSDVERKLVSTNSTVKLVVAGGYLYVADGQVLRYTATVPAAGLATWTTVTGTPAVAITGLATDGYRVWVGYGASGIYSTTRGSAVAGLYHSLPTDNLEYVKGRLMAANDNAVYNVTAPNAAVYNSGKSTYSLAASTATSITLNTNINGTPSPVAPGELIVASVFWNSASETLTTPAGWTVVRSQTTTGGTLAMLYRVNPTLATTVTVLFSFSGAVQAFGVLTRYENVDSTAPLEASSSAGAVSTPYVSPGSVSTARAGSIFVLAAANTTPGPFEIFSPPDGFVETTDFSIGGLAAVAVADLPVSTATTVSPTGRFEDGTTLILGNTIGILASFVSSTSPAQNQLDALFTHGTVDFTWVGFAEGQGDIYAAGYSGDKSLIYRTQVREDGTALDAPIVAGALPDGEIVRSIYGYLGFLFIGTDRGVRMTISDANGDLTIGALIETDSPVRCFEGQGKFVWFGWEDYDVSRWASGTYDGLGRLDLQNETSQLVPAFASDLMLSSSTGTTEQVQSVVTFGDRLVFSIADQAGGSRGVYAATDQKVTNGYLDSGLVSYGISDTKVATYLDLRHRALIGSVTAYLSPDEGVFVSIGSSAVASSTRPAATFDAGSSRGDVHEIRLRLTRSSSVDAVGPVVTRATLRSEPAPSRGRVHSWPLVLGKHYSVQGLIKTADLWEQLDYIEDLFGTQTLITCRQGSRSFTAFIKDYEFVVGHQTDDKQAEQGICTVVLKEPSA